MDEWAEHRGTRFRVTGRTENNWSVLPVQFNSVCLASGQPGRIVNLPLTAPWRVGGGVHFVLWASVGLVEAIQIGQGASHTKPSSLYPAQVLIEALKHQVCH